MSLPFFFVGKKDGKLRPIQDYQYLNEGTIKNTYPLPLVKELLDKLQGYCIFTKLDLCSSYNNVRIKDSDEWKAAFKTNCGLFEPLVMFFGLCKSPLTFQAMMNNMLKDMMEARWLIIYMDNFLILSESVEQDREQTCPVMQRLREHKSSPSASLEPRKSNTSVWSSAKNMLA